MKQTTKKFTDIFARYLILIIFAFGSFAIIYSILTPLTIYPIYYFFKLLFSGVILDTNMIQLPRVTLEIIPACVAGSAYFLFLMLNLATPEIKIKNRFKIIFYSFGSLLIFNILRIIFLGLTYSQNSFTWNFFHQFFWYFGSIFFVAFIWFVQIKKFKIKKYPFISDLKFALSKVKYSHNTKTRKKN